MSVPFKPTFGERVCQRLEESARQNDAKFIAALVQRVRELEQAVAPLDLAHRQAIDLIEQAKELVAAQKRGAEVCWDNWVRRTECVLPPAVTRATG